VADLLILTISSDNGPPFVCAASDIGQARDESAVHSRGRRNARTEVAHWTTSWSRRASVGPEPLAIAYDEWALIKRFVL